MTLIVADTASIEPGDVRAGHDRTGGARLSGEAKAEAAITEG